MASWLIGGHTEIPNLGRVKVEGCERKIDHDTLQQHVA
jgi:hypothetical protein